MIRTSPFSSVSNGRLGVRVPAATPLQVFDDTVVALLPYLVYGFDVRQFDKVPHGDDLGVFQNERIALGTLRREIRSVS